MAVAVKASNPKDVIGSDKMPFHLVPQTAIAHEALAYLDGALKYGRSNWRVAGVKASVYYDAAMRHVIAWFEGEDLPPDSLAHHLAHARACLGIILDAMACGKLIDDRMYPGGYHGLIEQLTPNVARLKARYADKAPTHYTRRSAGRAGAKAAKDRPGRSRAKPKGAPKKTARRGRGRDAGRRFPSVLLPRGGR